MGERCRPRIARSYCSICASRWSSSSDLVGDLDALARDAGTDQPSEPRSIRLDDIVTRAIRRAQRRTGSVTIEVREQSPGVVMGDAAMIERALMNVLDNAVKWSPTNGTVHVDVTGTAVTVTDNGPGIDAEEVPHVFDSFWRAPAARSMPGSGLGLSIVRRVVDGHQGEVVIDANPDGGTRVRIALSAAAIEPS